jgi:hypothetical protein
MKPNLNMEKIAKALHAKRKGKVSAKAGYFGANQLLADVQARFRAPAGGGRSTDPAWTERRLVPLKPRTLKRLEEMAIKIRNHRNVNIEPMQLAAILLEKTTDELGEEEAESLILSPRR